MSHYRFSVCLRLSFMLLALTLPTLAVPAFAAEFYVSPTGNDAADGSKLRPFATLSRAVKAAEGEGGATISMLPGTYYLTKGVQIGEKCSGTKEQPLRIIVSSDFGAGEVRISGGVRIDDFRPITSKEATDLISDEAKSKVVVADLSGIDPRCLASPGDKYQVRKGAELFYNDKRMTLARWPNEGFVHIKKVIDSGRAEGESGKRPGAFTLEEDRPSRWKIDRGVWLGGFWCHDWSFETLRVAKFDPAEKRRNGNVT